MSVEDRREAIERLQVERRLRRVLDAIPPAPKIHGMTSAEYDAWIDSQEFADDFEIPEDWEL